MLERASAVVGNIHQRALGLLEMLGGRFHSQSNGSVTHDIIVPLLDRSAKNLPALNTLRFMVKWKCVLPPEGAQHVNSNPFPPEGPPLSPNSPEYEQPLQDGVPEDKQLLRGLQSKQTRTAWGL